MSHADTLRGWAGQCVTPAAREPFLAGAEALDTLDRVRDALTDLRGQQEAALQRWDLHDTIHILTEVLEGDTE